MVMYMRPRRAEAPAIPATRGWTQFVMVTAAALILLLGVVPDLAVRYANVGIPQLGVPDVVAKLPPAPPATPAR